MRPRTVLKTAGLPSTGVCGSPSQFDRRPSNSTIVHRCALPSGKLAVFLAVSGQGTLNPKVQGSTPARAPKCCTTQLLSQVPLKLAQELRQLGSLVLSQ